MRSKTILLSVALTLSLVLNGAALGYLYAQLSKSKEIATLQKGTYIQPKRPAFLSSISEDKRVAYQKIRKENTESLQASFKKLASMRGELLGLLGADTFSEAAYKKKLEEIIVLQNEIQRKRIEPTLKLAEMLTHEERQKLIEQLRRPKGYRQPVNAQQKPLQQQN